MKYGSNYWEAFSPKMKRNVRFFSDLEYDHWILVETDPNIKHFCEQPLKIDMIIDDKKLESIFDMWIQYKDGQEVFVEVKYSDELNPEHRNYQRVKRQTEVQSEWCRLNHKNYKIQTDREIRDNRVYLENMRTLLPFARHRAVETDQQNVLKVLDDQTMTIAQIQNALNQIALPRLRASIYLMIYNGRLTSSNITDCILGKNTEVMKHA